MAFLWGIVTMFLAFFLIAVFGGILIFFGYDLTDSSNIPQLESLFSLPAILILIIIQPVAEEFFFRGFLLDKTTNLLGTKTAIILTSILFGIAHLSFRNVYPAVTTSMIGLLLAYSVVKTKNLSTSIIAHVLFNIASFSIYLIGKSFHLQSVIL
jgi:membrane protease YdiL (CAAX protease family)